VLAQFAILVFGIFAVMSLVIDMGYVTLTRVQMQSVADSSALEGVRLRNLTGDGFQDDCARRIAARDVIRYTFDDDFDLTQDAWAFGAGPVMHLSGGDGNLNARQLIDLPADRRERVYKPGQRFELNQSDNLEYGDMVSGTFTYTTSVVEDDDYHRHDENGGPEFVRNPASPSYPGSPGCEPPPAPAPTPPGPLGDADGAFLVRLRRTRNADVDDSLDKTAGVSSGGPTLPLFWGQGSTIQAADPSAGYSVRHHGFTVRATSIAQVVPTMSVGLPHPSSVVVGRPVLGASPFALKRSTYDHLPTDAATASVFTISPTDGSITDTGGIWVGQFAPGNPDSCDETAAPSPDRDRCNLITRIGSVVPPPAPQPFMCTTSKDFGAEHYVPVFDGIPDSLGTQRVVEFGRVFWKLDCPTLKLTVFGRRNPNTIRRVAYANTTGGLAGGWPAGTSAADSAMLRSCVCKLSGFSECPPECPFDPANDPTNPTFTPTAPLSPVLAR